MNINVEMELVIVSGEHVKNILFYYTESFDQGKEFALSHFHSSLFCSIRLSADDISLPIYV